MSLFIPSDEDQPRRAPVHGKVSIGVPTDELVLVKGNEAALVGKTIRRGKAGVPDGMLLKERHVEMLVKAGVTEVEVTHGNFPSRLDFFRILRRADSDRSQFVADPDLNEKYGLGERPTSIPVVLPIDSIEKMAVGGMKNYDRRNNRMFCSSSEPPVAMRAEIRNRQYTGQYTEVECVPTYGLASKWGKHICPFRSKDTEEGKMLPCKPNFVFYFNILTHDPEDFDLGSFFKFETSSIESGMNIMATLREAKRQFGRINWVPMELQIFEREKATPGGMKSKVPIVTLAMPTKLMLRYQDTVDSIRKLIEAYSLNTDIEIEDVVNEEAYDAEFRPEVRNQVLAEGGTVFDEPDEPALDKTAIAALDGQAMQLPVDQFHNYVSRRDSITDENIESFRSHVTNLLNDLDEEAKAENFEINSRHPIAA